MAWRTDCTTTMLLQAVRTMGGYHTAAKALGLSASRRPRGYWRRFETAVAELRVYLASHSRLRFSDRLPTHRYFEHAPLALCFNY